MSELPSLEPDAGKPIGSPISIRPMAAPDLPAVVAIDKASFTLPWPANSYRFELFENPGSLLYVAEIPGKPEIGDVAPSNGKSQIIGMIVVWVIIDEAHIATIAVHPDYRGQGIAQELLSTALIESIRKGVRSATLEVRQHNGPAQRLYQRFHFVEVGRRPRYYHDNHEDALIMTASGLDETYLAWLENGGWKDNSSPLTGENE
jgi:[ribosomal protein S18]-alanine N-acetyltransferase